MPLVIVAIGVILLLLLMIRFKMNGFIALVLVALAVGLMQGMPLDKVIGSIKAGVGGTLGSLALIMGFGAMLGKMLADENRKLIYTGLKELGYDCVYPSGAFYLFVKSPEPDAAAFSNKAKALNLLIVPADSFGCPGYVRVSYCVNPEMIKRSLPAFAKLIEQYKQPL